MMNQLRFACWSVRGIMAKGRARDCDCRRIIKNFHLDLLCMIETKLESKFSQHHSIERYLKLFFSNEGFLSNFECSLGGRILLKWNSDSITFFPIHFAPQLVHGEVHLKGSFVICVYGTLSLEEIYGFQSAILLLLFPVPGFLWVILTAHYLLKKK